MDGKKILKQLLSGAQALRRAAMQALGQTARQGEGEGGNPTVSEGREDTRALLFRCLHLSGLCGIGFLLAGGEIAFGARPLATALLACIPDGAAAILFGIVFRALISGGNGWIAIVSAAGLWSLRSFGALILPAQFEGEERFREGPALQITLGCAAATASGLWTLIAGGFLFRDLFGLLLSIAVQPPLILAYRWAFDRDSRFSLRSEGGQALLAMSALLSLKPIYFLGFSIAAAVAFFLTLYVSKTGGTLRGGVAGFLFGLVCDPILAPVMGLGGLVCGFLWEKGVTVAALAALFSAAACNIYAVGNRAFLSSVPDLILSTALAIPVLRMENLPKLFTYAASAQIPRLLLSRGAIAQSAEKENRERLQALKTSMESLSDVFYRLSDRMKKPGASEVRALCDKTFREHCMRCPLTTVCWVREQGSTADAMTAMVSAICRDGMLSMGEVPSYLAQRCKSLPKIINEINDAHIDLLETAARQDKMEVLALDYRAMAGLLSHACHIHAAETYHDAALTKKVRQAADGMGLRTGYLTVVGKRRLQVVAGGVDPGQIRLSPNRIREAFGDVLGVKMTSPRFDLEGDYVTMMLTAARRFSVESARAGCEKANEEISGDSMAAFENREDYYYTLISDGMGSGRDAALTSRMCTVFLRTMLAAGNPKSVAIEMLNNFIRNKNLECFATVDLLEIDLLSGRACFVKSGAAPSYVLRDGKLFKISSGTLPIGITREIRAEEIRFELEEGDIVVLISDGIAQNFEDGLWLVDMLTFDWKEEDTIQTMCDKILCSAQQINHRADDMSVAMLKIAKVQE